MIRAQGRPRTSAVTDPPDFEVLAIPPLPKIGPTIDTEALAFGGRISRVKVYIQLLQLADAFEDVCTALDVEATAREEYIVQVLNECKDERQV